MRAYPQWLLRRVIPHSDKGVQIAAALVLALFVAGCQNDARLDSSNRGTGSRTAMTSLENVYIIPRFVAGACATQVGDTAKLRFTATNNRTTEMERLVFIKTEAADAVQMPPESKLEIPPKSSIAAGQPLEQDDREFSKLSVALEGLRQAVRPGMSVDVIFGFEKAGPIKVRTPVEACPTQRGQQA
jgi:hypothetical protein